MKTLRLLVFSIVVILVSCGKDQEVPTYQSFEKEVKINLNLNLDFDLKLSGSDSKSGPNPGYNTEESFSEFDHVFADEIDLVFSSTTSDYTNTLTFNPNDLSTAPTLLIPYGSYTWSIEDSTPENPVGDYILRDYLPVFATGTLEIASSSVVLDLKVDTDFGLVTVEKAFIDSAKMINSDQYEKEMVEKGDYLYLYVYESTENEIEIRENVYNSVVTQTVNDTGIVEAKTHYNYFLAVSEVEVNSVSIESGPFKYKEDLINIGLNFANELIAWYPLNGNALDYSDNNFSGNVFGASATTDRNGIERNALDFNKSERDYLKVDTTLDQVSEDFTFSFWVNPEMEVDLSRSEGENIHTYPKIFPQPVLHPTHGQNFGDESGSVGSGIFVGTNGVVIQEHSHNYVVNRIVLPITISGWTNISVVYTNNSPTLYVNGQLLKEVSSGARKVFCSIGSDFTNRSDYSKSGIGSSYAPGYENYFEGQIDNFGIWNRILNQDEIKTLARLDFELDEYLNLSTPIDPLATCDDGIQNGDETGIDCGGSCSVCTSGTFNPNFDGPFGGATIEEGGVYTFPTSAQSWAGWTNSNSDIYPLGFPNGGTITFTASAAADAGIYFRFERLPYDENDTNATEPSFNTETITISGETATEYTVTIEAQDAANTYSSALMYLTTRDVAVTITDIKINL